MDFRLSREQEEFRRVVRDFAEREIAPHAERWDHEERFPTEAVLEMGRLGLFGLVFPEEHGGSGADFLTYVVALEEIARVDSSMAITLEAGVSLGAMPLLRAGSEEQKQRWLVPMVEGRSLGAFGLTEAGSGSDTRSARTRAELDEDSGEWVITGQKTFITNSGTDITSCITITARTGDEEISAIVVPVDAPGLDIRPAYRKMGWHASDTHELVFDGCRVPAENLLGERGDGLRLFLDILDEGRIAIAAIGVGMSQGCLDASVAYALDRQAFGGPIGRYQGVAFKCADMAVAVEAARALTYRAAWMRDEGLPVRRAAAMAKLQASETAVDVAREAVQVHGGYGFMDEYPVSRHYRDAKVLEIGEGTSEVQRVLIARDLGLPVEW